MGLISYECLFLLLFWEWILYGVFLLGYALYINNIWMILNSSVNIFFCFIEFFFFFKKWDMTILWIWFFINFITFIIAVYQHDKYIMISSGLGFVLCIMANCVIQYNITHPINENEHEDEESDPNINIDRIYTESQQHHMEHNPIRETMCRQ